MTETFNGTRYTKQSNMVTWPRLFKKTKTEAIQQWDISVVPAACSGDSWVIATNFGQVDGAIQETTDTISDGKNIGRANETSPFDQAVAEAQSKWEKQVKKGYVEKLEDAQDGVTELGGVAPMLAQSYDKHKSKIMLPAYIQPKLDGTRCIAIINKDGCTLWTRTRKPITSVPHIISSLEKQFGSVIRTGGKLTLDGELYNHAYKDRFEELISLIRQTTPAENHTAVEYHVYDVVNGHPFSERLKVLHELDIQFSSEGPIEVVPTKVAKDQVDLDAWYNKFLNDGYEGAIVRNARGLYDQGHRSYDLQKMKTFMDAEFKIVGVREGRGKLAGHGIFICAAGDEANSTFDVKLDGPLGRLHEIWMNQADYIGLFLTVTYQGKTAYGMPRFPVGRAIRDYE